jgi:DNA-binding IclR family transcriptional regulator
MQPGSSATLQTADRALQVLQQFRSPGETLTVSELAARLGFHRSTASRLVSTLEARGFLERAAGECVGLGPEAARLGRIAVAGRELLGVARPIMDRLAGETGEAVTLAVPAGAEMLTVAESDGKHFVCSGNWVGAQTPAHCAADGKVLLAFDAIPRATGTLAGLTRRTITDAETLASELASVRLRGFAVARGELEDGLNGIAVPVWDGSSYVAALCVSGPAYRLHGDFERSLAPILTRSGAELERELGAGSSPVLKARAAAS